MSYTHVQASPLRMPPKRNFTLDIFRLIFAFGVVLVHLGPNEPNAEWLGRAFNALSVPFFVITALYFFIRKVLSALDHSAPLFSRLHLDRLWVPYLTWTLIYLGMRVAKNHLSGHSFTPDWFRLLAYGGSGIQLYFLPFLLLCQAWALSFLLIGTRRHWLLALPTVGAAFVYDYLGCTREYFEFGDASQYSLFYVAAAFLLIAVQRSARLRTLNFYAGCVIATIAVVISALDVIPASLMPFVSPIAGYAATSAILGLPAIHLHSTRLLCILSTTYGIYLMHHALIEALEVLAQKAGVSLVPYSLGEKLVIVPIVCVICIGTIDGLRRSRRLRYLLLGEKTAAA